MPFVARGAGTGLSGGALPVADGVLIVLARMRRILDGRSRQRARRRRARRHQPRDLAGGRADPLLPAGPLEPDRLLDRRQHRRELGRRALLQVRLHDQLRDRARGRAERRHGRRARPRRPRLRPARRVRRLRGDARRRHADRAAGRARARRAVRTLVAFFEDTGAAGDAVTAIVGAGIVPGAIEMMDRLSIKAAEQATGAGYRLDAGAALLVELDGPREECTARSRAGDWRCCARPGALDVRVGPRRARARADVEDPQGGVRRDGPDRARLLRAGRRDPAHPAVRGAAADRRARGRVRAAGGQRLPRRRRQPPPARLLRRGRPGRARARPRSSPG